jgi:hypothetical protein
LRARLIPRPQDGVVSHHGVKATRRADTTIKYTERGNPEINITDQIGGLNSEIQYHVQAPGDLYVTAPKGAEGAIFCGVPPPPF